MNGVPHKWFSFPAAVNMLPPPNRTMDSFQQTLKLAHEAHRAARSTEAEALCRVLLQINPASPPVLFLLGMILHQAGRDREAADWLRQAADLQPGSAQIFSALGLACRGLGDWTGAVRHFARAGELEPRNADHFYNLGLAWHQLDDLPQSAAAFQQAVQLNPRDAGSWNNLGKIYKQFNRLHDSLAAYDRALEASPGYDLARHGRALTLLTLGRLGEGFREYESRWAKLKPRDFTQPRWSGDPVAGRTVFVHAEQGFGDAIHFARFVPLLRERGARVILECRAELKSLFLLAGLADEVIAFGETVPPHDYYTSIMHLPGLLGITENNIPARVPYLTSPPPEPLPSVPAGNLKVGFVWAGSSSHGDDRQRSLTLAQFAPLLPTPGATFYSLQLPVPERDQALLRTLPQIVDLSPRLPDFLATAGWVMQLDLIIAVDTSVAHLAGALARPTWLLAQFDADWRWQLDRTDTPWYPTLRLFRQSQRGQWAPVIAQVAEELRALVNRRA